MVEYFRIIPRWRNVPRTWTEAYEYEFFRQISDKGWGICAEILSQKEFEGAFKVGDLPSFVAMDSSVMKRLKSILDYINENSLESLRIKEQKKPRTPKLKPQTDELTIPYYDRNPDSTPVLPQMMTSTASIISFGHIITDRVGFQFSNQINKTTSSSISSTPICLPNTVFDRTISLEAEIRLVMISITFSHFLNINFMILPQYPKIPKIG
jgi:chromodomain-helicase-DNA-binding protein 7